MAQVTALQPYGVPGRTRSFVAKAAAAVVLVNIIGSSAIVSPNHISDLGKNLLIEGDLEVRRNAYAKRYFQDANGGWTGTFTNGDAATVTVKGGIITGVA